MFTVQACEKCRDFEIGIANCVEAYGYYNAVEKCRPLIEDLNECIFHTKHYKRLTIIKRERERQMKKGQRGYIEMPRMDLL